MPAPVLPTGVHSIGPGYLFYAPLATTEPAMTVVGSIFTDAWAAAWIPLGYTDDGHTFTFQSNVGTAEAAEAFDPLAYATDSRTGSVAFSLLGMTAANLKRMLNGGTITVTGATTTTLSKYEPPDPGTEVRCMLGWESTDGTERNIWRQCFQGGSLAIPRRKGAANRALIPATFNLELPATGSKIFQYATAGVARG